MSKLKPGFNDNVSNEAYHGDVEYLSSSSLKLALRDIRTFVRKYVDGEKIVHSNQDNMDFGSYIHTLILEPELVDEEFTVYEGAVKRGEKWEKFKEENKDKIIIGNLADIKAKTIVEAYKKDPHAPKLICDGVAERSLCVKLDGVKIKVRADYLKDNKVIDIKTTQSLLDPEKIQNVIVRYDYDLSAALYVDALEKFTGKKHEFYFVFIKKDSFEVGCFKASQQMIDNGRRKYRKAIEIIKKGRKTGKYFEDGIIELDIPTWALYE
jgi:hypothetical protein